MKAHELAHLLLAGPDHNVILNVYGYEYDGARQEQSHGAFSIVHTHDNTFLKKPAIKLCCAIDARKQSLV